jgi:hypothetical protein
METYTLQQVFGETYEERDIELVMSQCKCSRDCGLISLSRNKGDIVNAIMMILDKLGKLGHLPKEYQDLGYQDVTL